MILLIYVKITHVGSFLPHLSEARGIKILEVWMKKSKYVFIWILPVLVLCVCLYYFINSAWIFATYSDQLMMEEALFYLLNGIIYFMILLFLTSIAIALTIFTYKRSKKKENDIERD